MSPSLAEIAGKLNLPVKELEGQALFLKAKKRRPHLIPVKIVKVDPDTHTVQYTNVEAETTDTFTNAQDIYA